MANPFLQKVATQLLEKFGEGFSDIHVVLPSRRAGMYFRHYLSATAKKGLLLPHIMSFEDFVKHIGSLDGIDQIDLLLELYKSFKVFDKAETHTLERFAPLGGAILKDFNLIDHFLTTYEAKDLFEFLKDVKALERWGDSLGEHDAMPADKQHLSDYFSFWENLKNAYWHFREKLLNNGQAYNGLAFRKVYEKLDEIVTEKQIVHVAFAGFSQLLRVEEQIIGKLINLGKASTYWDTDDYYLEAIHHEAGDYFRRYARNWLPKGAFTPSQQITQNPKHIRIIQVNHAVEQAKVAGDLLAKKLQTLASSGQLEAFTKQTNHTLVAMPDEDMLIPLLHSLPVLEGHDFDLADHVNITMGLSFAKMPFFDLVDQLFQLQENARKSKNDHTDFYHRNVLAVLRHPYMFMFPTHRELFTKLESDIRMNNRIRISSAFLLENLGNSPLYDLLFSWWEEDTSKAVAYFLSLTGIFSSQLGEEESLEAELLFRFYTTMKRMEAILLHQKETITVRTFRRLLQEVLRGTSVPFTGKPIKPVQIMGMLESRTLDFENVIVLSCNEGVLPTGKLLDSMIPFDLRLQYGLPTHKENDSSFAYTFYRLLHQAKELTFIYTEPGTSDGKSKEKSRFLLQIKEELGHLPGIVITEEATSMELPQKFEMESRIVKDEWIIEKISRELKSGVSPSLINTYIKNPVEFFYKRIFELKEGKEVEESLDYRSFGTFLHKALEDALAPWEGKAIVWEDLARLLANDQWVEDLLQNAAKTELGEGIIMDEGKNYLLKRVAAKLVQVFFKQQKEIPVHLVSQEKFLEGHIPYQTQHGDKGVFRSTGKADRIDIVGNQIRVVDYKTGKYEKRDLIASSRVELLTDPSKGKIIQLMLYKYNLLNALNKGNIPQLPPDFSLDTYKISSGFYFFRNLNDGFVEYHIADEPAAPQAFMEYVEEFVRVFLEDLFDRGKDATPSPSDFLPYIGRLITDKAGTD